MYNNLPEHVSEVDQREKTRKIPVPYGLKMFRHDEGYESTATFWKSVIVDQNNNIVARNFHYTPFQIIGETFELDKHLTYTKFEESTVLMFYTYVDYSSNPPVTRNAIATQGNINIVGSSSRVSSSRTTFMQSIDMAIKNMSFSNSQENQTTNGMNVNISYNSPESWEDFCVPGFCNVFVLIDESNQITDNRRVGFELYERHDEINIESPRLIHVMSHRVQAIPRDPRIPQDTMDIMTPSFTPGLIDCGASIVDGEIYQCFLRVPKAAHLTIEEAEDLISEGGALIGFNYNQPDITVQFRSAEYQAKVNLSGQSFNPVHRWHVLMDEDPARAELYLKSLPGIHTERSMKLEFQNKINEAARMLAELTYEMTENRSRKIDSVIFPQVRTAVYEAENLIRRSKNRKKEYLVRLAKRAFTKYLNDLEKNKYATIHRIYSRLGRLQKMEKRSYNQQTISTDQTHDVVEEIL